MIYIEANRVIITWIDDDGKQEAITTVSNSGAQHGCQYTTMNLNCLGYKNEETAISIAEEVLVDQIYKTRLLNRHSFN